ncbi:MAG: homoserine kinase [Promicromonosporaceae bacterium]|nr:homoserine kinase [Promicromonosporaceae bacterium]
MQLGADHVIVRVPATSGNVGSGFDALGLAIGVYDEVEVRLVANDEVTVEVHGEGAGELPSGDTHLVARALHQTLEIVGAPLTGLHLTCTNAIPHGRGLGSSASAAVAGIVAARALLADPHCLDSRSVLAIATDFEGHPDNAAPAIWGGATIAWQEDSGPCAVGLEVDPAITATVLIPQARFATTRARALLPAQVPHADAAFNVGRSALLVEALARRPELLLAATADRLHQDYRSVAMASSHELMEAIRAAGFAAMISGAGPTVLVLTPRESLPALDRVLIDLVDGLHPDQSGDAVHWRALRPEIDQHGAQAHRIGS